MRRLLRLRNAQLLLGGEALSLLGDRALFLALAIWVRTLTGSNTQAGLVFFAVIASSVAAPLIGHLVDRIRRQALMVCTDVAIGVVVLLLLLVHSRDQIWLIYLVAVLYGFASVALNAARPVLMTIALPDDLLAEANGLFQSVAEGLRLIAPLVGAGLFAAFGGGVVAVMDAVTFFLSAICLLALHIQEPRPEPEKFSFLTSLTSGVRYLWSESALRQLLIWFGASLLLLGFTETAAFAVVTDGLHRAPSFIGVLMSLQGVGAIAGGVTAARLIKRAGDVRAVGIGLLIVAGSVGMLTTSITAVVFAAMALAGVGVSFAIVGYITALQTRTPNELMGRVFAAGETLLSVPQAISVASGALLLGFVDYRLLLASVAVVTMVGGVALVATKAAGSTRDSPADGHRVSLPSSVGGVDT